MRASAIWLRVVTMTIAIVITLVAFAFWGSLKTAVGNFLSSPPSKDQSEVTVQIIPSKPKPPPKQ